jgi:ABC-type sugar transport system substrate-binding protein
MNRRGVVTGIGGLAALSMAPSLARAQNKPLKIGYNVSTLANPFFQGMTKGLVEAVKDYPGVDLVNQQVDVLILNPVKANAIAPAVQQADGKRIPAFTLDRGFWGGSA